MTAIGKINKKMYLIQITGQTADGYGGLTEGTTATKRIFWAYAKETSGNRQIDAGQQVLSKSYKIIARYNQSAKIKAGDYIISDGEFLTIQGAIVDNRFIEIDAEKRDDLRSVSAPPSSTYNGQLMIYDFEATEGQTEVVADVLVGKDIIAAFLEGDAYIPSLTNTARLQVKSVPDEGKVIYPIEMMEGAVGYVIYQ